MSDAPVRVLMLTSSLEIGGAEKQSVGLLNLLDRRRFAPAALWLHPQTTLLSQLDTSRLRSAGCLDVRRKLDWAAVRRLTALMDGSDVEVVMCANEYPALYAWLAARRARRPPRLVEVFHTTEYARTKERLQMLLYRRVFRAFDLLVYVSENQQRYWQRQGLHARSETCIQNGIDCERFTDHYSAAEKQSLRVSHGLDARDYVVALCAALRPEKAHGDFVRAIAMLRTRLPTARGLIIGDGPERPRIEALIAALGLQDAVRITGFQNDVRPLLACSDVAVLTSHKIETFSIAALEAMSLGKPMILTRIGGASEQIQDGENGFLYEPGDIDTLVARLEVLANPVARGSMGRLAGERVRERFSEAGMMQRYEEQLQRLAAERRAATKGH